VGVIIKEEKIAGKDQKERRKERKRGIAQMGCSK
jgi:hypothetical protein